MRRLWAVALLCAVVPAGARAADPVKVLFVGNSFTHGRYDPARNDNAGFDSGPGAAAGPHVHDLLCLTAATCSVAERVAAELAVAARSHAAAVPHALASRLSVRTDVVPAVLRALGVRLSIAPVLAADQQGPPAPPMMLPPRRREAPPIRPVPIPAPGGPFAALVALRR